VSVSVFVPSYRVLPYENLHGPAHGLQSLPLIFLEDGPNSIDGDHSLLWGFARPDHEGHNLALLNLALNLHGPAHHNF